MSSGVGHEVRHDPAAVGDCRVEVDQRAAPDPVVRGSALNLTLTVRAACESAPAPLHMVLVVDSSAAAADPLGREIKDRLTELVEWFDPSDEPDRRLGVVEFAETGQSTCELSGDPALILSCIEALGSAGTSAPEAGLTEALAQLRRGRTPDVDIQNLRESVVLVQAGAPANECPLVLEASNAVKSQGVLVIGMCAGPDCDVSCTRRMATSPRYFFEMGGGAVHQFVDRIREDLMVPRLRTVTVTDTLPANMVYRTGSSVPPAQVVGKSLVWSRNLPAGGLTMTLQAMPKELGRQPTSVEAHALVEFVGADAVSAEFPIPVVNVLPEARIFLPVARWDRAAP